MKVNDSPKTASTHYRLASLDILRGFDLFMLVFLQPVIVAFGQLAHPAWLEPVLYQLDHEVWEGFRCWDLVMPLFLFMTGAAMPFSFSRYDGRKPDAAIYRKILRRFLLLFLLGMVVQGNLLGFDFHHIYFYTNTLQSIATGYLISALLLLHFPVRTQVWITAGLLVVYTIPMMLFGDYSREGSFANQLDHVILGRFRGDPSYTWIWSSLTFAVTVMLGTFAGRIIRTGKADGARTTRTLFVIGVALVVAGWLWSFDQPVIKRIWTGSMTLLSGGYCFLLMSLFYYVIDVRGYHRGLDWLKIYGMNSIAAYIMGEAINFRSIARSLSYGLERYMGEYYSVWLTFANFLIVFLILRFMYRRGIFLKI
ncbi:MAG: DUF5009 domain-containing protein [Muribaculaceae bacterium]|nr:DUF5009 domain-containing protein [Muribaculaceae bacterium]